MIKDEQVRLLRLKRMDERMTEEAAAPSLPTWVRHWPPLELL